MTLPGLLAEHWGLDPGRFADLPGGMNSANWLLTTATGRYVVKAVPADDTALEPGLRTALDVARAGIVTGLPLPARIGDLTVVDGDRRYAVLGYVDGEPLSGTTDADRVAIGTMLGRVHTATRMGTGDLAGWTGWFEVFEPYLDHEPWIRPAVTAAVEAVRRAPGSALTWARLHGDPGPSSFLLMPDGRHAVIDWGASMTGPVLYDVASAAMFLGADAGPMVTAYVEHGPAPAAEIESGLDVFLRLRWAAQAGYFAYRFATGDHTGSSPAADRTSLDAAERALRP